MYGQIVLLNHYVSGTIKDKWDYFPYPGQKRTKACQKGHKRIINNFCGAERIAPSSLDSGHKSCQCGNRRF